MFQFIFQGTQAQFAFFKKIVLQKVPNSALDLEYIEDDLFHCIMTSEPNAIFKTGMLLSSCYAKFEHLKNTVFDSRN